MIYLTFAGYHDEISENSPQGGAVLSIFRAYSEDVDEVYIISTDEKFHDICQRNINIIKFEKNQINAHIIDVKLDSPIDYDLVYQVMHSETKKIVDSNKGNKFLINISSGTPTMTSCWVLLNQSGLIPNSTLVQSFANEYAKKRGKTTEEVNLEIDHFPQISSPDAIKSELNKVSTELKIIKEKQSTQDIISEFPNLIGSSIMMQKLKKEIIKFSKTDINTLITGPTGTGKEIVANELVNRGPRSTKSFKTINLGCKDSSIVESELFGHEKGSFTGASSKRDGYFKSVDGGTLFIDEIGDLPYDIQTKLLRTLEYGEIQPVGSDDPIKVDVRVIAATNKDLNTLIKDGKFRKDLLYRFGARIETSSLLDRIEDIPELIDYFRNMFDVHNRFSDKCISALKKEKWEGNVRQLRSVVELSGLDDKDTPLEISDISPYIKQFTSGSNNQGPLLPSLPFENELTIDDVLNQIENYYYTKSIERHNGNQTKAAELDLHIKPHTLRKRIKSNK